ncbi:hypothetical protein GQ457_16G022440 [Hibiscus cannabinus]
MKRMRQSRKINVSNDGEIRIAKVKQKLPSLSLRDILNGMEKAMACILAGHPVLQGYWSQRRFLKDLVNRFNNAAYED